LPCAVAEVEHGRIAVEALSALEIRPALVEQLSSLDIHELPQQLVLKTTNPILLAYEYVYAVPPFRLALHITRHKEIEVQEAVIEQAHYRTLCTRDGLAVTAARFTVRNARRQFLRLELPEGSEVWSVFVNRKAEKPALARQAGDEKGRSMLIKMVSSAAGFPLEIVYVQPVPTMNLIGVLDAALPRPDMVVTRTRWDVFLPIGVRYGVPDSTLDLIVAGVETNPRAAAADARHGSSASTGVQEALRIDVPTRGIHFAFEKLYANQSPRPARFAVRYTSAEANQLGLWLSGAGVMLIWLGILALGSRRVALPRNGAIASLALGVVLLVVALGYLGASPVLASALTLLIATLLAVRLGIMRFLTRRRAGEAA
jgi:hypothetical protein